MIILAGDSIGIATDSQWKFPHFEEMLLNNAAIKISLYSKGFNKVFNEPLNKR